MEILADVRHAWRSLIARPTFTSTAVMTLALGAGATIAFFAVADAVLLRPLPYGSPNRLVTVLHGPDGTGPVAPATYFEFKSRAASLSGLEAAEAWGVDLEAGGRTERVPALRVTAGMFDLLQVAAARGRTFLPSDGTPGAAPVVVLSDALWTRRFGRDQGIIGTTLTLNGGPYTVIGVMPPSFPFAPFWQTRAELWAPLDLAPRRHSRGGQSLRAFGRLAEGTTVEAARAEIDTLTRQLATDWPDSHAKLTTTVKLLLEQTVGAVRPTLLVLLGMAALVLLIAVANLSIMLLVRGVARQQEVAVRVALGATRGRLLRLVAVEGLLIGLAGAATGAAVAGGVLGALTALLPPGAVPRSDEIGLSPAALVFALVASVAAGVVGALLPTRLAVSAGLVAALHDGARGGTAGAGARRLRSTLVGAEVALALVLLAGAGLLGSTLVNLQRIDLGLQPDGLVATSISLEGSGRDERARLQFFEAVQEHLQVHGDVARASAINHLPLAGDLWRLTYAIEGRPEPEPGERLAAAYRVILPDYFRTVGQNVIAGREFDGTDREGAVPVAIVNEALARRHWPGGNPLGRRLIFPGPQNDSRPLTIVGVVTNARQQTLVDPPVEEIYLPFAQRFRSDLSRGSMTIVARAAADEAGTLAAIQRVAWGVDPRAALYEMQSMDEVLSRETWREAFASRIVTFFAALALAMAAMGAYGVVGYAVAGRRREFGIRMALGASPGGVRQLALAQAIRPLAWGVAAGLGLTMAAARAMEILLFGVSAWDPLVIAGAVSTLVAATIAAAWVPARRAGRMDPAAALRAD